MSTGNRKVVTSPSAVETRMAKYYDLDGSIPATFMPTVVNMKVFDNRNDRRAARESGGNGSLPHKLKALDDDLISYGQRERLAAAMLKGNEEPVQASGVGIRGGKTGRETISGLDEESTLLTHFVGTQRNNVVGPKFLKISSTPVIVNNMHPREVLARERQRQKNLSNHNQDVVYSWAGATVLPVPSVPAPEKSAHTHTQPHHHQPPGNEDGKKDSTLSATIAKWKAESVHRNKMELKQLAKETKEKKQAEMDAIESKIKYKKGLTEFRTNLKERLRERKDPLQGSVMRQFDDEFAQNMMEKYEGHSMSVDAVLNMLGAPLGKNFEMGKAVVLPTDHMEMNGSGHLVVAETTAISGPSWSAVRSKEGSKLRCVAAAAEKARERLQKVKQPESKYTFNEPMSRQRQRIDEGSQEMGLPLATREGLPGMRQTHPTIRIQASNDRSFGIRPPGTPLGGLVASRMIGFNVDSNGDVQLKIDTITKNLGRGKRRNYEGHNEFQVSEKEKEKDRSVEMLGVGLDGGAGAGVDVMGGPEGMSVDQENASIETGVSAESRPASVLKRQLPRQPPPSPPSSAKLLGRHNSANGSTTLPGTKSKVAFLDMTMPPQGQGLGPGQGQGLASQAYNTRGGIGGGFVYGGGGGIGGDMGMMMAGGVEGGPSLNSIGGQSMTDESTLGGVGNMGFGNVYGPALIRDKTTFHGDSAPHIPSQSVPYATRSGGSSSAGGGRGGSGGGMSIVTMGLQTNAMKVAMATAKLPASPYKSDAEAMRIYHSGVPSGGAMRIWPQTNRTNNGRYWHGKGPPPINSPNKYLQLPPEKTLVPREGGMRPAVPSSTSPSSPYAGLNASSSLADIRHAFTNQDSGKAKSVMNDSIRERPAR